MGRNGIGRPGKIDHFLMKKMLKEGRTQTQVAEYFGVSRSAISQALKTVNKALTKHVVMESAARIVESEIDAAGQLTKSNMIANNMLDDLQSQISGNKKKTMGEKTLRDLTLKTLAEIRKQLGFQADIFEKMVDFQAVAEFQKEILDIIYQEVTPDERRKIIERLKARRSLRSSVRFSG